MLNFFKKKKNCFLETKILQYL